MIFNGLNADKMMYNGQSVSDSFLNGENVSNLAAAAGAVFDLDLVRTAFGSSTKMLPSISGPEGITLVNLIGNYGNFGVDSNGDGLADGLSQWDMDNRRVIDNTQYGTPRAMSTFFGAPELTLEAGHIYYSCILIKGATVVRLLIPDGASGYATGSDQFNFVSAHAAMATTAIRRILIQQSTSTPLTEVGLRKWFVYDLTAIFGVGKEPSKTWMDNLMTKLISGEYFTSKKIRPQAGLINFANTRLSGFRCFDRRVLMLHNLIGNAGDFAADSDGNGRADNWGANNSGSFSLANKVQSFTANGAGGSVIDYLTGIDDGISHDIYFGCGLVKADSSQVKFQLRISGMDLSASHPGDGTTQLLGSRLAAGSNPASSFIQAFDNRASGWTPIQMSKFFLFNLTRDLGKGNEPSAAEMMAMIQDWLDSGAGYFTIPSANKFRPSLFFDGVDDFLFGSYASNFDIKTAPLAVFTTIKIPTDAVSGYLFSVNDATSAAMQYGLYYTAASKKIVSYLEGDARGASAVLATDVWYDCGFIWDGVNVKYYVNGALCGPVSAFTGVLTSRSNIRVGCRGNNDVYFKGDIAALRVYAGPKATEANILKCEAQRAKNYIGA